MRTSLLSCGLMMIANSTLLAADANIPGQMQPPAAVLGNTAVNALPTPIAQVPPGGYYAMPGYYGYQTYGAANGGYWQPGGYGARVGSPYYYSAPGMVGPQASPYGVPVMPMMAAPLQPMMGGNPYSQHFGPGFYRHSEYGHYRFPYYSYRRPWYYPGTPVYNRDTNMVW